MEVLEAKMEKKIFLKREFFRLFFPGVDNVERHFRIQAH